MEDFRFAILGAGGIANKFADAVDRVEGCRVAAVASKSEARAADFAARNGVPASYGDYARLLEAERPDCAYIATTCDSHHAVARLCLEHRVPVLCEKAMFTDAARTEAFFRDSEAAGVFSMEALWSLFLPALGKAREWVRQGRVGEVACADFAVGFAPPRDPGNRFFNPALGGGAANDLTVYGFHILPWIVDRPIEEMSTQVTYADTGVDETEAVALRLTGGMTATVRCTLASAVEERLELSGSLGRIVVPKPHMAMEAELYDGRGELVERFVDSRTPNGFVYEVAEVMRCVRAGRVQSDVVSHAATLACARWLDGIRVGLGNRNNQGVGSRQ